MNLNNIPTSYHESEDRCPSCAKKVNVDQDLDKKDYCNNCRDKSNISIILAMSENLTIGKDNDLPWNLPSDLKMFKEVTLNSILFMGRKCYESIGRPLPKRENVVLTSNTSLEIPGCVVVNSISEFLSLYKDDTRSIFIIGGANLYEQTFDLADTIYLTLVQGDVEGDVKIKGFDLSNWTMEKQEEPLTENGHTFRFITFKKIK